MRKCGNAEKAKGKIKSFTLVEVVFTISIIGVLLAILMPAMSAIKLSAQKIQDVSHLKKIAEAWRECIINRGWINNTKSAIEFFSFLGGYPGRTSVADIVLNDPSIYVSSGDRYGSKVPKDVECVYIFNGQTVGWTGKEWLTRVVNDMISNSFLVGYCMMCNLSGNVPLDTTPLGFSRGLNKNGTWDEKAGLYGSKGGYVVYCDGHTVWFDGNRPAKFLKWDQSGYTSDIRQTVPTGTIISCIRDPGTVKVPYNTENTPAFIHTTGTGGS
jgi:hypothetical protein